MRKSHDRPPDLFDLLPAPAPFTTQQEAMLAAFATAEGKYRKIIELLHEKGPLAAWQIAAELRCQLHQVSGRLTELRDQQVIENTGERRRNPPTGASGQLVRLKI